MLIDVDILEALIGYLKADTTLMAMLGGIGTKLAQGIEFPYLRLAIATGRIEHMTDASWVKWSTVGFELYGNAGGSALKTVCNRINDRMAPLADGTQTMSMSYQQFMSCLPAAPGSVKVDAQRSIQKDVVAVMAAYEITTSSLN